MKKKIMALTVAAILAATSLVGGSMAYFTATDSTSTDFTVGTVDVEAVVESGKFENLLPGDKVTYITNAKNTGNVDAYVCIDVTVPSELASKMFGNPMSVWGYYSNHEYLDGYAAGAIKDKGAPDYVTYAKDNGDGTTTYHMLSTKALAAGATTSIPATKSIAVSNDFTQDMFANLDDESITTTVTAIQAKGFNNAFDAYVAMGGADLVAMASAYGFVAGQN